MSEAMNTYTAGRRRMTAFPLGGLGTGNVSLAATGRLRQWQLHNQGNHLGFLPQSFFALRISSLEPPWSYRRVLHTAAAPAHPEPAPTVNDDLDGPSGRETRFAWPHVADTTLTVEYPFARLDCHDSWPVEVGMRAHTPFVPLDPEASAFPLAAFDFSVTNRFSHPIHGWLLGTLQNAVGWDGVTPIDGSRCASLGGNTNAEATVAGGTAIVMSNASIGERDPGAGTMALWTPGPAVPLPQFADVDAALAAVDSLKLLTPVVLERWDDKSVATAVAALRVPTRWPAGPSPAGTTWTGGLALPLHVEPGSAVRLRLVYAWHFPNRYADFDRFGDSDDAAFTPPWIGNHYATRFADAQDVVCQYAAQADDLLAAGHEWRDALYDSDLPPVVVDVLAAQPTLVRSPTTFRTADGRFFGFEGVLGESTLNWNGNVGGSCPLNCTHVWNYEQAVSRLYPSVERSMRETDWDILQAPEGYLPHRVLLPVDGPQLHDRPIGGPTRPALDGMLGAVLKTYREVRQGAGPVWLRRYLPHARRLMDYVGRTWDPSGSGVLTGDQPVTHDISLNGANMFVGGLWLAALRAMEEMTVVLGLTAEADGYRQRFLAAGRAYDELLFNGEYYSQRSAGEAFDFGSGCLADQLCGQWWAHQLGLGYLLPADHVRSALLAVVRYNTRRGFRDFLHGYRVFADADDTGLLNCTWPQGGRPEVPIRYADEVWTGVEYQVAGHCFYEGLLDEGLSILQAVRDRYDGSRRNPFNEVECGDHYARAMSGWAVLDAYTGASYDAATAHLRLGITARDYPLLAGTGWGRVAADGRQCVLRCLHGTIAVSRLSLATAEVHALHHGPAALTFRAAGAGAVDLDPPAVLGAGSALAVTY